MGLRRAFTCAALCALGSSGLPARADSPRSASQPAQASAPAPVDGLLTLSTSAGGLVELSARGVPLATLLERLSEEGRVRLSYTDRKPAARVTAELRALPAGEAMRRLLDHYGVDYALRLSSDQSRIEAVIVSAGGAGSSSSEPAAPAPEALRPASGEPLGSPSLEPAQAGTALAEPPRPAGVELPNVSSPPLPTRPEDLPTSPFIPYYGSLNPDGPPPDPNEPVVPFPSPGDIVEMDGIGPDGVPTTQRKSILPETIPEPLPPPTTEPAQAGQASPPAVSSPVTPRAKQ